jgi:Uma2 family endonuclease
MAKRLLTAEEYAELPEHHRYREELVRGVVCVREPNPGDEHGSVQGKVFYLLYCFVTPRRLGWLATESGFIVETDPDTVAGPDVSFVANEPPPGTKPAYRRGAPDLAVEVRSPSNSKRYMAERAAFLLRTGTRLVWTVDPPSKTVTVHRPDQAPVVLVESDILTGEDVLPGFQRRVADVFDLYSL